MCVIKAVIAAAVAVAAIAGSGGAVGQWTPVTSSLGQAADDYNYTSVFDKPIQYMPKEKAFEFVRRAAHETTKERIWAYVPGKLVLLGKESDSSLSVVANMEILIILMKENSELDLLHTHVKRYLSCIDTKYDSDNPDFFSANDSLCRSQIVENLKISVPSPYDLSAAIIAAELYNSLQPDSWKLNNFVFTPISEVQYHTTPIGIYRLRLRGDRALRTKMGMIGSYASDFPEEIVPKRASGVLSEDEMRPYVRILVNRYGQFKEFAMSVANPY